jgi:15-cis-phytoene synthase
MTVPALDLRQALAAAYDHCEAVTRRASSNFYWGFRLLPHDRRRALCAVYAFCRSADDIADEPGATKDPRRVLARWREELGAVYGGRPRHPIALALADTIERFAIPREHFDAVISGVEMDLERDRYETWEGDLEQYCYRVAGAVGLVCIEIFGYRNPSARQYAIELGLAFQLTNILRDVLEDGARGRLYLPLDDLRQFDCSEDEVLAGRYTPQLAALLAFECGRARAYYLRAAGALAAEDRSSLATAEAMRRIYERLLDRIEARRFDVFGPRVALKSYEKVALAASGFWRSQLRGMHLRPAGA